MGEVKVVFAGAGAAGIACAEMYVRMGVKRENVLLVDTVGVVYTGRTEKMNPYKARFAADTKLRTLAEALKGRTCSSACRPQGSSRPRCC